MHARRVRQSARNQRLQLRPRRRGLQLRSMALVLPPALLIPGPTCLSMSKITVTYAAKSSSKIARFAEKL
eukprot:3565950-Rhodomonas_salina.1